MCQFLGVSVWIFRVLSEDYYLGYTESAGRLYTLSGEEVTFSHYASTEPNSDLDTCITIYGTTGIYYDVSCSEKFYGVCSSLANSGDDLDTTTEGTLEAYLIRD